MQNYQSWSPEMVPDPDCCCYGLEYFCFEGNGLWTRTDLDLIELAEAEREQLRLARSAEVLDGCVIRQPKAYPVYDKVFERHVEVVVRPWTPIIPIFISLAGMACTNTTTRIMP